MINLHDEYFLCFKIFRCFDLKKYLVDINVENEHTGNLLSLF